jgi:hypothetical protein
MLTPWICKVDSLVAIGGDVDDRPRPGIRDADDLIGDRIGELQRLAGAVELLAVLEVDAVTGIGAGAGAQHDVVVGAGAS